MKLEWSVQRSALGELVRTSLCALRSCYDANYGSRNGELEISSDVVPSVKRECWVMSH